MTSVQLSSGVWEVRWIDNDGVWTASFVRRPTVQDLRLVEEDELPDGCGMSSFRPFDAVGEI